MTREENVNTSLAVDMPRVKEIQADEVSKIWKLKTQGKSVSKISTTTNRSKKSSYEYKAKRRSGRLRRTNIQGVRLV